MVKRWFWLDYVDSLGSHRVEVDSVETGCEVAALDGGIEGFRIIAQATDEVVFEDGYTDKLNRWLTEEASFQAWLADLDNIFSDVDLDLSGGE